MPWPEGSTAAMEKSLSCGSADLLAANAATADPVATTAPYAASPSVKSTELVHEPVSRRSRNRRPVPAPQPLVSTLAR